MNPPTSLLDPKWCVFLQVAELGSLTRAAAALDVPQSMLSRHIAHLEQQCGARLFRRTGRGVVLTDFGAQIFPRLKNLAAQADHLLDAIRTSEGVPIGEVRVGMLPSSVPMLAAKMFSLARERFPRVQLHLSEGTSAQLEEHLREGRMDMALLLREGPVADEGEAMLAQITLKLVGRRGDPVLQAGEISLAELAALPLVVPSAPHLLRARLDTLAEARGLTLNIAVEADSIRLQHEIAAAGGGYAITSGLFELHNDRRLQAARIVKPELLRSVVLSSTLRRPHTLATREIERLILRVVPSLLGT